MAKRMPLASAGESRFTEKTLKAFAKDLESGRIPLDRQTVSDDLVTGLRAIIYKSGKISFHASYHYGDERPFLEIGRLDVKPTDPEYLSIDDAREVTKTIKHLADHGTDVRVGLQRRLVKELKTQGKNWRVPK